jgi:hypothetical protein
MQTGSISVSPRILPLVASTVLDADAIKTTIATVAAGVIYAGAALNGATASAGTATPAPSGLTGVAQYPIAVASSNAGSYVNGSTIQFSGTFSGETVTRTATVSGTGGGATFVANGPLDTCNGITVAAQADTSGAWTFGWNDIACKVVNGQTQPFRVLRPLSTGNCVITCGSGHDATVPLVSGGPDELVDILRVKFSNVATTVTNINLYE